MTNSRDMELVLQHVSVLSTDPALNGQVTDVRVRDDRIAAVGSPAMSEASPSAQLVNVQGATLVPLMDASVRERWTTDSPPPVPAPGSRADFVVVSGTVSMHAALHQLVVPPSSLVMAVVDGCVVAKHGRPTADHRQRAAEVGERDARWGVWRDSTGYLDQRLSPDGRTRLERGSRTPTRVRVGCTGNASSISTTQASGRSVGSSRTSCTTPAS